ncbi:MAG TPA: gliding motility-associated ABC transporter permease subunit GldF [Edaphocola sp.]|nr:gliding motility-associated ABC transporter permease subunit GldF [Edaphocola sp.]
MKSIFLKEMTSFLGSLSGYVALVLFLATAGLVLWVLPDSNILDYGYASMEQFFRFVPWLLAFLIPAITMKSFSEEFSQGTIEWLMTKPLSYSRIILGKFLAAFVLVIIALMPTLVYLLSVQWLAMDGALLDYGAIMGAYVGLLLLVAAFTAIGLFCSSLTGNQIISFLAALFVCLVFYDGFSAFSQIPAFSGGADYYLAMPGMDFHFNNLGRGLIDLRDVVYFLSVTALFMALNRYSLQRRSLNG